MANTPEYRDYYVDRYDYLATEYLESLEPNFTDIPNYNREYNEFIGEDLDLYELLSIFKDLLVK